MEVRNHLILVDDGREAYALSAVSSVTCPVRSPWWLLSLGLGLLTFCAVAAYRVYRAPGHPITWPAVAPAVPAGVIAVVLFAVALYWRRRYPVVLRFTSGERVELHYGTAHEQVTDFRRILAAVEGRPVS